MKLTGRTAFWTALTLVALLLVARLAAVPLIDPDEPRFARTSVEMLRGGDLVVPSYEWVPRLVKPPMLHWVQATFFRLFGVGELTARLPSVLATLGSLAILGWILRRRFGPEGALWSVVTLGTMPLVVAVGRLGTTDALLAVHVLAALALDLAEPEEAGPYRQAAIGALLGLAFLIKGPVGVIVTLLVILAGRTASGRNVVPTVRPGIAFVGAFLAVALPWCVAFLRRLGFQEALELLRGETVARYFAGTDHVKPAWYYLPVLAVGCVPWITPALVGLMRVLARRRDPAVRTALYCAAGLLAGLLFFSLGKGKLPNYILPLAPLVAILATWELGQELDAPRERTLAPTLLAATLGAFGLILLLAGGRWSQPPIRTVANWGAAIHIAGALFATIGVVRHRPRFVWATAGAASWAFMFLVVTVLVPGLMESRSTRELIREVPELSSRRPLVVVAMKVPSLTFYLDRIPERVTAEELGERIDEPDRPVIVIDPDDLPSIAPAVRVRLAELGRQGKYRVYEPRTRN